VDFVQWCGVFLGKLLELQEASTDGDIIGVRFDHLERALSRDQPSPLLSDAVLRAYDELTRIDIIQERYERLNIPRLNRELVRDQRPLWIEISRQPLEPDEAQMLRALNRLSEHRHPDFAYVDMVPYDDLYSALGLEPGYDAENKVNNILRNLKALRFARQGPVPNRSDLGARSTYSGLVWEHRGAMTISSQEIDALLQDGETHTVEFKRQLDLRTDSDKAEFIKDVIALANASATGPARYILIGITNDGKYHDPQDPEQRANRDKLLNALTPERLQTIVSTYTSPALQIRYAKVDYFDGPIGKLEVVRDVTAIPYQVSKSIGSKDPKAHRITKGQVPIRDGTITRDATTEEIENMKVIAERARQRLQR
jgi:hypothetical protein